MGVLDEAMPSGSEETIFTTPPITHSPTTASLATAPLPDIPLAPSVLTESAEANRLYDNASKSALKRTRKAVLVTMCMIRLKRGADKSQEEYSKINADLLIDEIQKSVGCSYPNLARLLTFY
jgi:hypothetical protein